MDFGNLNLKRRKNKIVLLFLLGIILIIPLPSLAGEIDTSVTIESNYGWTHKIIDKTMGGSVELTTTYDTTATLTIPVDYYTENLNFKIVAAPKDLVISDRPLPSGQNIVGNQIYDIKALLTTASTSVDSFNQSITTTFGYLESEVSGLDEDSLKIYKWDNSQWTVLADSVVNSSANTVIATTSQFNYFGIFGEEEEGEEEEEPPPSGGGGGGGALPTITTKVIFQGKASPLAYLTVLKDGQALVDKQADNQANFKVEITNITPGVYTFGIWAKDKNNIKSLTFSFTMNVISGAITTVSGIFLPPTISLNKDSVKKGEILDISGQVVPQSQVEIHISSNKIIEEVIADATGAWLYKLNTGRLEEGTHSVRAKATTLDGLLSTFSQTLLFGVGRVLGIIKEADANNDNRVNLIDFSILLYNWGVPKNPTADLNNDGQVDLIDFSILLYWWTG